MIRPALAALAALALAPTATAAAHDGHPPDAEIFATNNTAVITDPADPRLDDPLKAFAREVERIVERGGGTPRDSQLLDGVFFSSDLGTTTFERSRSFDVDHVAEDELHAIADSIRGRFQQQSVLTFDHLPRGDDEVDAIELEVPGVTAQALRDGLLADATARERLFGGSVTLDERLLLVADLADAELARTFAEQIGGDLRRAQTRYGERDFVEGPAPVKVEQRTLFVTGAADDDAVGLRARAVVWTSISATTARSTSTSTAAASTAFAWTWARARHARLTAAPASGSARRPPATGHGWRATGEPLELDGVDIVRAADSASAARVTVEDLSSTDVVPGRRRPGRRRRRARPGDRRGSERGRPDLGRRRSAACPCSARRSCSSTAPSRRMS